MTEQSNANKLMQYQAAPLLEVVVVFLAMLGFSWITMSANLIGAGSIAIWGGIGVATVFLWRNGVRWSDYGLSLPRGRHSWLSAVGLAFTAAIAIIVTLALTSIMLTRMGIDDGGEASDRFRFFLGNPYLFAGYLVSVIWFGAALGEELFMRGFILNRLADLFGYSKLGWSLAVLVQGVAFGALHFSQGLGGMITTGLVGLIFGTYYVLSNRNLFPIILAHGLVNTIGVTAYYLSNGAIT